jgi:hypothetical protein
MNLSADLKEFIESLNARNVEYLVAGAHAMAFHGYPRFTGDIDLFINTTFENAERIEQAVDAFGFASTGLRAADFLVPEQIIQLGVAPNRIDLMTFLSGITFEEAWAARHPGTLDGIPVFFLSKPMLIKNKKASGRTKDLADLEYLGE